MKELLYNLSVTRQLELQRAAKEKVLLILVEKGKAMKPETLARKVSRSFESFVIPEVIAKRAILSVTADDLAHFDTQNRVVLGGIIKTGRVVGQEIKD